ncbi:MAG: acetolactate synthase small subunit [Christensenellales bacterium]|jgi:acetolactate synthase-1/3 small subunit
MNQRYIISVLVNNQPGVLTRISGMFSRRGFNIQSVTVCETEDEKYSRMTIVISGDEYILEQILKQLAKTHDVKKVTHLSESESVFRELIMVKIAVKPSKRRELLEIASIYEASVIDLSPNSLILELTGMPSKIDGFLLVLRSYNIIELARSGISALMRGDRTIKEINNIE